MSDIYAFHYSIADGNGFEDSVHTAKATLYFPSEMEALQRAARAILDEIEYVIRTEEDIYHVDCILNHISNCEFREAIQKYNLAQDHFYILVETVQVIDEPQAITLPMLADTKTRALGEVNKLQQGKETILDTFKRLYS